MAGEHSTSWTLDELKSALAKQDANVKTLRTRVAGLELDVARLRKERTDGGAGARVDG